MTPENKSGFKSFEAARNDLKSFGFTSPGPYATEWTNIEGAVFIIGGSLKGKTGQSARGLGWVFGYHKK